MTQNKNLPDCWWITPDINSLEELPSLLELLKNRREQGIRHIQMMQKRLDERAFYFTYNILKDYCDKNHLTLFIHGTSDQAKKLHAKGCCYYADTLKDQNDRPLPKKYSIGIYCNNLKQLQFAEKIGADFASLSLIKKSKSYPDRIPIGWEQFEEIIKKVSLPVYAVGGLNLTDKDEAIKRGAQGIMGIRYDYTSN